MHAGQGKQDGLLKAAVWTNLLPPVQTELLRAHFFLLGPLLCAACTVGT